jgi:hypothetical protein
MIGTKAEHPERGAEDRDHKPHGDRHWIAAGEKGEDHRQGGWSHEPDQRRQKGRILTGAETDICVLSTAVGAIDHGYRVIIAEDAVCSSSDRGHDSLLALFAQRFSQQIEVASRISGANESLIHLLMLPKSGFAIGGEVPRGQSLDHRRNEFTGRQPLRCQHHGARQSTRRMVEAITRDTSLALFSFAIALGLDIAMSIGDLRENDGERPVAGAAFAVHYMA